MTQRRRTESEPDLSQYLTTGQAARLIDRSPDLIRRLAARGVLVPLASPHGRLFARADVEALRDRRRAMKAERARLTPIPA
jgi:hypothetical protein